MPLTFLSGVFYSIHSLPLFWQELSHFQSVFYMIDGFRYGFFGVSDVSPLHSFRGGRGVSLRGIVGHARGAEKRVQAEALAW